jgi:hypothetical protein
MEAAAADVQVCLQEYDALRPGATHPVDLHVHSNDQDDHACHHSRHHRANDGLHSTHTHTHGGGLVTQQQPPRLLSNRCAMQRACTSSNVP